MYADQEPAGVRDVERSELDRLARVLRSRIWLILACTLLTAAVALIDSLRQEQRYTASASLLFRDPVFAENLFGAAAEAQSDPIRDAATNVKLVGLGVIAERTAGTLGEGLTPDEVSANVAVAEEGQSDVVAIDATDHDPALARRIANTFAREFIAFRSAADRSKLTEAKRLTEREFDALGPRERAGPRGKALSSAAERLGVLASLQTGNAELVQPAQLPTSPSSPKPARNTVLGLLLGLLLGTGLALFLERFDRRLRSVDEVQAEYGLPVVGTIPRSETIDAGLGRLALPEEEAFRTLRAALRYFDVDQDLRSVLVTSGAAEEGKSTVAWNLARAAAVSSQAVLVEADLRNPSLAATQVLFPNPGLAELLTHQVELQSAIQTVTAAGRAGAANGDPGTLDVIVAGKTPPNPAELLESRAMRDLLDDLGDRYEFVVIDTAPTGVVSDAFPLLGQVSGVIAVCRLGSTTRDSAAGLRLQLGRLRAPLLGVVVNCAKGSRRPRERYPIGDADYPTTPTDIVSSPPG